MLKKMKALQPVQDMIECLNRWQSISSDYKSILEERLVLVCKLPERLGRKETIERANTTRITGSKGPKRYIWKSLKISLLFSYLLF